MSLGTIILSALLVLGTVVVVFSVRLARSAESVMADLQALDEMQRSHQ